MNLSPIITPDRCAPAPSLYAKGQFHADFEALGASSLEAKDAVTLEATFNDVPRGVTAANLLRDTLFGAKLVVRMPLTGIPYNVGANDVVEALKLLPGVAWVNDSSAADRNVVDVVARSQQDVNHLAALLNERVDVFGRGGRQSLAINVITPGGIGIKPLSAQR